MKRLPPRRKGAEGVEADLGVSSSCRDILNAVVTTRDGLSSLCV